MRATLATSAIAGLVFLAIVLFGPSNPDGPPQQIVAQEQEKEKEAPAPKPAEPISVLPEKLLEEADVKFIDTPLKDAASFLSQAHTLKVILNVIALTEEGVAIDEPITMTAKSPLYLTLNRMLKPLGLTWYYKDDMLFITTNIAADEILTTKYYPVKPLLDLGLTKQQILDLIQQTTQGPWIDIDGTGGQALFIGQTFSVRQTFHVHLEIAALLAALKTLDQPGLLRLEPKEHEKLRQALKSPVQVEFIDTPLKDAVAFLSDTSEVPIVLNKNALTEDGVADDEPVNFTLVGKSLETTMELMLNPYGLEAVLEDGTILITTNVEADENLTTVLHNVTDIADSQSALDQLADAIETVTEGPWMDVDGTGGVVSALKPSTMIIRQTEPVHQEIEKLLVTLRRGEGDIKLKPLPAEPYTQVYRMNADTAEDLLATLPEFVAPGTWQDEKNKDAPGTIRKVAAGQTFVKYPGAEKSEKAEKPKTQPKPDEKREEKPKAEKAPEPQYIVVPQAVLIIRHTKEVHREIGNFLSTLLPTEFPQPSGGGGGFF